ncbi:GNAT family N-acetyltransferase [Sphaerisporangium sp. NPDC051011]|uniref:GNAT family N-acetyltransferase n=1 Tax=Sphaerisporangium sp. NPDC051011 TaxID=3155792 RepID=UPI0033C3D869
MTFVSAFVSAPGPRGRVSARWYAGPPDLRAMQELTSRVWTPGSRWHVGDLAWGRFQHTGREPEWPTMLWHAAGRTLAWGWIETPGHLDLAVDPEVPELADEVLAWFADTAPAADRTVVVSSAERHLLPALDRHGYRPAGEGPFFTIMSRSLDALPPAEPPPGYRLRPVTDADVPGRVHAHRAAFHPSRVTEQSYHAVRAAWPYRAGLDWIAEAEDGEVAAFCLAWLDEADAVALIEPAGTVPEHRRLGLARAVCAAALHAARDAGARVAVVGPRGDDAHPVPARLYRGLGFGDEAITLLFHTA